MPFLSRSCVVSPRKEKLVSVHTTCIYSRKIRSCLSTLFCYVNEPSWIFSRNVPVWVERGAGRFCNTMLCDRVTHNFLTFSKYSEWVCGGTSKENTSTSCKGKFVLICLLPDAILGIHLTSLPTSVSRV